MAKVWLIKDHAVFYMLSWVFRAVLEPPRSAHHRGLLVFMESSMNLRKVGEDA